MRYHRKFRNIDRRTRKLTKEMLQGWGVASVDQRADKMRTWLQAASRVYGMTTPRLVFDHYSGHGYYSSTVNEIHMPYPSVVTVLHEFRHAMQWQKGVGRNIDAEDDARGWSLSLYYAVAPRTLERLAASGAVFFADDLTT